MATKKVKSKQPRFNLQGNDIYMTWLNWARQFIEVEPEYQRKSRARDKWLAELWPKEPHIAGVINAVLSIDSNRGWSIEGGRNLVFKYVQMMHRWYHAPNVMGWRPSISGGALSYYTSDLGWITEIERSSNAKTAQNFYNVDPTRCELQTNVETPLVYTPLVAGSQEFSQEWLAEDYMRVTSMPSNREEMAGLGFCALSRAVRFTRIMMAVFEHDEEELGKREKKALMLLQGISQAQWEDAQVIQNADLDSQKIDYFSAMAVIASMTGLPIDAKVIPLNNMPSNIKSMQEWTSVMMYGYALCFGYDAGEFYPVQFGSLGRGNENEIQKEKATAKGGASFILSTQEQLQRPDIMPPTLKFEFEQRDETAEIDEATVAKAWVDVYSGMRASGAPAEPGLTLQEYRTLLASKGVIPNEMTQEIEETIMSDEEVEPEGEKIVPDELLSEPKELLVVPQSLLTPRARRVRRDYLMSQPHVHLMIEENPAQPIVRYRWPAKEVDLLWGPAGSLVQRVIHPSADLSHIVTPEDVENAIDEIREVMPEFCALLEGGSDGNMG